MLYVPRDLSHFSPYGYKIWVLGAILLSYPSLSFLATTSIARHNSKGPTTGSSSSSGTMGNFSSRSNVVLTLGMSLITRGSPTLSTPCTRPCG